MRRWLQSLWLAYQKRRLKRIQKRLIEKNRQREVDIEVATGEPFKLTPAEKARLRDMSKGIPRDRLKEISNLDIFDDDE